MTDNTFSNQTAIITGGAQGIGGAVAERLASLGVRIAIWDMDLELAGQTAASLPVVDANKPCIACKADVSSWGDVQAAYEMTRREFDHVDILVNSAGIAGTNATVVDYDVEEFQRIIDVNLMGTFHVNKVVVPDMKQRAYGRIVNIASVAGKEGNPNASAYSSSKAGVIGFTKSLGKELADVDIAVNCVTPAAARTRIFDQMDDKFIDFMLSKIPRGRFLELDEAASMITWLCSRENSFTTAGVFDLSGGRATY